MATIAGNDAFNSLEIASLRSYQESVTYPGTQRFYRVPLVSDNMELEYSQIPESPEITALGAVKTLEFGQGLWRGSFRTLIYYNAIWFNRLICQLVGGLEVLSTARQPNNTVVAGSDANTHLYHPQSFNATASGSQNGITWGSVFRLIKGGPDNTANIGYTVTECHVVGATFDFPETGWPTVTWEVIGLLGARIDSAPAPQSQVANEYAVKPGDIGRDPSHVQLPSISTAGSLSGTRNIRSASFVLRNGVDFGQRRFANNFDGVHRAGKESNFTIEGRFTSFVEQTSLDAANGEVYWQWVSNSFTGDAVRIRAISAKDGATHGPQSPLADQSNDRPYAFDIFLPNASIREADSSVKSPGTLPLEWTYKGFEGPIGTTTTGYAINHKAPVVIQTYVNQADEPSVDSKYSTAAEGGNGAHSDLVV